MNKIKIIIIYLLIPFFVLIVFTLWQTKKHEEFQQKAILAKETHKVLNYLMFDLREAREKTFLDAPADGLWHDRIAFIQAKQGALEYKIKEGHLFRINKGKALLIADDMDDLRIRRQKETPDIVEVQIEAKKKVAFMSYLKIRTRQ